MCVLCPGINLREMTRDAEAVWLCSVDLSPMTAVLVGVMIRQGGERRCEGAG